MDPFDSSFYIAAATAIPVLYVALILQQGTSFDSMLTRLKRSTDEIENKLDVAKLLDNPPKWRDGLVLMTEPFVFLLLRSAVLTILLFCLLGEITAIVVLYNKADNPGARYIVLISTIGLFVITAVGPTLALIKLEGRYWFAMGKSWWALLKLFWAILKEEWDELAQARHDRARRHHDISRPEPGIGEDNADPH